MKKILLVVLLTLSLPLMAFDSPFEVTYENNPIRVSKGSHVALDAIIRIPSGYFIYKDRTNLDFTAIQGVHIISIKYPAGTPHADTITGKAMDVFPEGEALISAVVHIPNDIPEGEREIEAVLEFQGCEEKLCLRPEIHNLTWKLVIAAAPAELKEVPVVTYAEFFKLKDFKEVVLYGRVMALVAAFIAGLLTSFTPCVWPLIPVTLLIIGIQKKRGLLGNLMLSLSLVAGIAVTYGVMGVIASAAGSQIGFLFQKKAFLIAIAIFFIAMSCSMFGFFTIQLPASVRKYFSKLGGSGYRGAFLTGISLGFLATPCAGPLLASMFVWVAVQKAYLFGAWLLSTYALGFGICYVIVGTFFGALSHRVKNVKAGNIAKKILGVVLLLPALYYLNSIVPLNGAFSSGIDWRYDEQAALVEVVSSHKPLMIVFGARWCPPCVEIENYIAHDKHLNELVRKFVPLHIDATIETAEVKRVLDKYQVAGWPTIIFVSPSGKVYNDLKVVGEAPDAGKLAKLLEEVLKGTSKNL